MAAGAAAGAAGGGTAGKGPQKGKMPGGKPGNMPGAVGQEGERPQFPQEAGDSREEARRLQSLTVGWRRRRAVGWGCWGRGRSLSRGWSLVVVGRSEDVHAARWTRLLPLEPGAQAAGRTTGRKGGKVGE